MKKLTFLLLLVSFIGFSQKSTDSIFSKKLNGYRKISISIPSDYDKNSKKAYPLLILLDGDYLFDAFNGALSYGNYWDDLPELIVVGINQSKTRQDDCEDITDDGLPQGKTSLFYEFVGGELMSYLQNNYHIAPFRIIAGHDVTAGFMNLFLYKENPLFNAYISLSPDLLKDMDKNIPPRLAAANQPLFYYQSVAESDILKMKEKITALDEAIKATAIGNPNLNYRFDEIADASHYSMVLHSIPNALYQFFGIYKPISNNEYQDKIVKLSSGYVDYLTTKYANMDKLLGFKIPIRYNDFNAIESAIIKNKAYGELEQLATLAKKTYPKTMLGEYYMARYYESTGDTKRAIKSYQNAFTMNSIGDLDKEMMINKADALRGQGK